jgi:hypothetical protein
LASAIPDNQSKHRGSDGIGQFELRRIVLGMRHRYLDGGFIDRSGTIDKEHADLVLSSRGEAFREKPVLLIQLPCAGTMSELVDLASATTIQTRNSVHLFQRWRFGVVRGQQRA